MNAQVGVPFIMSTASTRPPEEVAEANGEGARWYQLYWCVCFSPRFILIYFEGAVWLGADTDLFSPLPKMHFLTPSTNGPPIVHV